MIDKSSSLFLLEKSGYVYTDYNATSPVSDGTKKSILEVLSK
nr:hypothetical protein [Wolbachia endosymbiont of Atemnus politus]